MEIKKYEVKNIVRIRMFFSPQEYSSMTSFVRRSELYDSLFSVLVRADLTI